MRNLLHLDECNDEPAFCFVYVFCFLELYKYTSVSETSKGKESQE